MSETAARVRGDGSSSLYRLLDGAVPRASCGGAGKCGKCRVRATGLLSPPGDAERAFLTEAELDAGLRLACLCVPLGECAVSIPDGVESGEYRVESAYAAPPFAPTGDGTGLGVAVDIGTTTVVMELIERETARVLAREAFLNSQRAWGADVLSRIRAACEGNAESLRAAIAGDLSRGLSRLLEASVGTGMPGAAARVTAVTVAANTTMAHLLLGLPVDGLGVAPFTPAATVFPEYRLGEICGETALAVRDCPVRIVPAIGAFVGGDIVAGLAALELGLGPTEGDGAEFFVDIGTNAEMALVRDGKALWASAAAGPAFEGGSISCGTGCVSGAVDSVRLEGNRFAYTVIDGYGTGGAAGKRADGERGGGSPLGLCGSGILDFLACALEAGLVREDGSLAPVCAESGVLLEPGGAISLGAADVRNLQLAKAAIAAALGSLLELAGLDAPDVARVHLAGGFGLRLREKSAFAVGLLPPAFAGRVVRRGNASLAGAVRALGDPDFGSLVDSAIALGTVVQLADSPSFARRFVDSMGFPRS